MRKINDNPWELLEIPVGGKISSKRLNSQNPYDFYIGKILKENIYSFFHLIL